MTQKVLGELIPVGGGDGHFLTERSLVVGRAAGSDIVLSFSNVSSRHCRLVLNEGYWYVQDLKSANGVRVNGVKVRDRRIDPGDTLTIARCEFVLKYSPQELGATGIPPREILDNESVFKSSLMQKAGLAPQAAQATQSGAYKDSAITEISDPMDNPSTVTGKRNYFDDLQF